MKIRLRVVSLTAGNENDKAMLAVELEQALQHIVANDPRFLPTLTMLCRRDPDDLVKVEVEI